jgi:hypothetical protein
MPAREHAPLPHIGDDVLLNEDSLVEVVSAHPGTPPTWRYLAADSRGKLIGYRDRSDESRAVVDVQDAERRLVVTVREVAIRLRSAGLSQKRHET